MEGTQLQDGAKTLFVAKQPLEVEAGSLNGLGAEEHPALHGDHKREGNPHHPGEGRIEGALVVESLDDGPEALIGAPGNESPRGSMPQSTQQHREAQIDVRAQRALLIPA